MKKLECEKKSNVEHRVGTKTNSTIVLECDFEYRDRAERTRLEMRGLLYSNAHSRSLPAFYSVRLLVTRRHVGLLMGNGEKGGREENQCLREEAL